jgi:hypothetical protein
MGFILGRVCNGEDTRGLLALSLSATFSTNDGLWKPSQSFLTKIPIGRECGCGCGCIGVCVCACACVCVCVCVCDFVSFRIHSKYVVRVEAGAYVTTILTP